MIQVGTFVHGPPRVCLPILINEVPMCG